MQCACVCTLDASLSRVMSNTHAHVHTHTCTYILYICIHMQLNTHTHAYTSVVCSSFALSLSAISCQLLFQEVQQLYSCILAFWSEASSHPTGWWSHDPLCHSICPTCTLFDVARDAVYSIILQMAVHEYQLKQHAPTDKDV